MPTKRKITIAGEVYTPTLISHTRIYSPTGKQVGEMLTLSCQKEQTSIRFRWEGGKVFTALVSSSEIEWESTDQEKMTAEAWRSKIRETI